MLVIQKAEQRSTRKKKGVDKVMLCGAKCFARFIPLILAPISQRRKLRFRKGKQSIQGCPTSKSWTQTPTDHIPGPAGPAWPPCTHVTCIQVSSGHFTAFDPLVALVTPATPARSDPQLSCLCPTISLPQPWLPLASPASVPSSSTALPSNKSFTWFVSLLKCHPLHDAFPDHNV